MRLSVTKYSTLVGLTLLGLVGLQACGKSESKSDTSATSGNSATTTTTSGNSFVAYDTSGKLRNSEDWIGKQPTVLNFWGTWCPPCRREVPDLVRLYAEYRGKGVEIIGLAVKDEPADVSDFASRQGMDWVMLMADQDLLYQWQATQGVPTTIFLDRTGKEIGRFVGAQSYEDFKPAFDAILQ